MLTLTPIIETDADVVKLQREFVAMPGLCLTTRQAQRLWGFDAGTCDVVLNALLAEGFLKHLPDGRFRMDHDRCAA